MIIFVVLIIVVGGLITAGVVSFFGDGASNARADVKKYRAELADANERVSICQTALIQIASGDPSPVFRASDALSELTRSYTKGITK